MKKTIVFSIIAIALIAVLVWFGKMNSKSVNVFETETAFRTNIIKKTVATGKVIPLEEVEIKPQISGIIDKIYLEEGAIVKKGDLIATVRVVPNEQSLINAKGQVSNLELSLKNAKVVYDRKSKLYAKGVIASQEYENAELAHDQAKQNLKNARNNYKIILKGSAGGVGSTANTNIRATASGMILEIPVEEGDQVIQSNNFNAGTTIASVADMTKMIFEGKVDEAEVGKIEINTDLEIVIGAIDDAKFPAKLNFIAPKGTEVSGTVQFTIKADVTLEDNYFLRAGYSANAEIILDQKDSVLSMREAVLQFDKKTKEPYVEVLIGEQEFEKRTIELGISDGENVEIIAGVTIDDKLKIWNKKAVKDDKDDF